MSKSDKISKILAIASGRGYRLKKARPDLVFNLIDFEKQLYKCVETGEELTFEQMHDKYGADNTPWAWCSIETCPDNDREIYYKTVTLLRVYQDEVVLMDKPLERVTSIRINLDEYHNNKQRSEDL